MSDGLRLLAVLAHPDDETLGIGSTLAHYAAEGVATYLLCATRGQRGWPGPPAENPGPTALGRQREAELEAAAAVLGLREVTLLDYVDGDLDQAEPTTAIQAIVAVIRRLRPQVVVTFGPEGAYGHPDHIAIAQLTAGAVVAAADATFAGVAGEPHRVAKLYYYVESPAVVALVGELLGGIAIEVDGVRRDHVAWWEWAITTRLAVADQWATVVAAVGCHRSQLPSLGNLPDLPEAVQRRLWGEATFVRAFSLVNGGRAVEDDLFAGLR